MVRLEAGYETEVEENLVPETAVQQVQDSVLHTADVQIHAAGGAALARANPITLIFDVHQGIVVGGINVSQLVPGRTRPLRHHVGIAAVHLRTIAQIQLHVDPLLSLSQWGLRSRIRIVRIKADRLVILYLRQLDGQHVLRQ